MRALEPVIIEERERIHTAFSDDEISQMMEYLARFQRLIEQ